MQVTPWLYTLEKELAGLYNQSDASESGKKGGAAPLHPNFRLWLTSEAHDNFPPILLQLSLKLTYESPPGLRENVLRTVASWPRPGPADAPLKSQLSFVLAWFHAVVQERRTFIPQGWTKFYEFSSADLRAATDVIGSMVPFRPLRCVPG